MAKVNPDLDLDLEKVPSINVANEQSSNKECSK